MGGAALVVSGGRLPFTTFGLESAVFCNVFEFQSCGLHKDATGVSAIIDSPFLFVGTYTDFKCQADRCIVTGFDPFGDQSVKINDGSPFMLRTRLPLTLNINDTLRSNSGKITLFYDVYNRRLVWCGSAACDAAVTGITVQGSDRCTFVTDKALYDKSGQISRQPAPGGQSYTVPVSESILVANGQQFICGTKFNQCSVDQDCAAGHTFLYNGLGAEASGGQLQIYGCVSGGTTPTQQDLDYLKGLETQPASSQYNYGNRCQVVRTQSVQCIPGSATCGSNAVCDVSTFTCKAASQVQCIQDRDCGVGETYDQSTKTYYQFACVSSTCQRQATRTVECRFNSECPLNWFCDIDGKCKESTQPKQACPSACCEGDPRYFDKPPPPGNICCPGGKQFAPTLQQCTDIGADCGFLGLGCLFKGILDFLGGVFGGFLLFLMLVLGIIIALIAYKVVVAFQNRR